MRGCQTHIPILLYLGLSVDYRCVVGVFGVVPPHVAQPFLVVNVLTVGRNADRASRFGEYAVARFAGKGCPPNGEGTGFRNSFALYAGHFSPQSRKQVFACPARHLIDRLNTEPTQGVV